MNYRDLAEKTSGAYAFDRVSSWPELVRILLKRYDARQVEAIVLSKWVRWACDNAGKYDGVSARKVAAYIVDRISDKEVAELVEGTFA